MISAFIIAAVLVVFDLAVKSFVKGSMLLGQSIELIPGVLRLTYIHNTGAAFGSFSDNRWVFMILSSVLIFILVYFLAFKKGYAKIVYVSMALILAGGIGNMVDRITLGYVIDYVDFYLFPFWKWIFNAADAFICVGVALLAVYVVFFDKNAAKSGKKSLVWEEKAGKMPSEDLHES